MPKKWKNLDSKQLFGNEIFGFREDKVQSPKTDKVHPVWVMDAPNWINIIPITAEKKVVLIKQYRFGNQEITLEIPGGMIDKGENPKEAAIRELKEETGFKANKIEKLFQTFLSPGYSNELLTIFLASDLKKGEQSLDLDEFIEVKTFNFDEILNMIKNNEITDSKTISAILYMNLNDNNW